VRFISEIKPVLEYIYTGLYINEIIGYKTAIVIIDIPKGKEQVELIRVVYILGFYISLICLQKLNNKGVFWNNEKNILYYNRNITYAYCGRHYGQLTLEFNKPKPKDL
jgi:hypothetical protein